MHRPAITVSDFALSEERRALDGAAKAEVSTMSAGSAALYSDLCLKIDNAIEWLVDYEGQRNDPDYRCVPHVIIGLIANWVMIHAYVKATGEPIPTPIVDLYQVVLNYYAYFKFHDQLE